MLEQVRARVKQLETSILERRNLHSEVISEIEEVEENVVKMGQRGEVVGEKRQLQAQLDQLEIELKSHQDHCRQSLADAWKAVLRPRIRAEMELMKKKVGDDEALDYAKKAIKIHQQQPSLEIILPLYLCHPEPCPERT
jgi:hypothetical protein